MKILLVYPETPTTFWSFKHAIKFISKKSSEIPLGLITVAGMLPEKWEKKLIDMNVQLLKDNDILWADYIFLSGMNIHYESFKQVVRRCNYLGVKVVAGGPMVTVDHKDFIGVDHFILNEAEITLPPFLNDLEMGDPKKIYSSVEYPDLYLTPPPLWHLLELKNYATMNIQYSRGCPFDCEFCTITQLNGRKPRVKSAEAFLHELNILYENNWRGNVFIVDDNFIGNKKMVKNDLLPALIKWSNERNHPFLFTTEVSVNLADDDELIKLMVDAGFRQVFVGIETPNSESLEECGKSQNLKRNLVASVRKLQHSGLMVSAGFIVGFDNDPANIFERQINFIQESGIVTAMVGLLNAMTGTKLFTRLQDENRLLHNSHGNNMDGNLNFIPIMNYQKLMAGYKKIISTIYSQKEYYERVKTCLIDYKIPVFFKKGFFITDISAFIKAIWKIGVIEKGKTYFWRLLFFSIFRCPTKFALAVTFAIYGYHFRRIAETI